MDTENEENTTIDNPVSRILSVEVLKDLRRKDRSPDLREWKFTPHEEHEHMLTAQEQVGKKQVMAFIIL